MNRKIHHFVHTDGAHCRSKVPLLSESKDSWVEKVSMVLASPTCAYWQGPKAIFALVTSLHFLVILLNDLYDAEINALFVFSGVLGVPLDRLLQGKYMYATCEVIFELYLKPMTILWLFLFHFTG